MTRNTDSLDRRSVLKKSSVLAAAGLGSVGTVAAGAPDDDDERRRQPEQSGSERSSVELSMDNAMSRSEFDQYKTEMAEKYGDEVVLQMDPGAEVDGDVSADQAAVDTQNLTWEASWNDEFDVHADIGKLLETDHALTLYSGEETDNNGRQLFFFWQWSSSNAIDAWYRTQTDKMHNHLSLTDSDDKLTDFEPASPSDVNGEWVDVGLNVGYGGVTMGLNGETYVKNGTIKPKTGKVDTGGAGQYAVAFDGCQKGTTGLNGVVEARTDGWILDSQVDWNLWAHGTTVMNCW
jgi:hypothetical protein